MDRPPVVATPYSPEELEKIRSLIKKLIKERSPSIADKDLLEESGVYVQILFNGALSLASRANKPNPLSYKKKDLIDARKHGLALYKSLEIIRLAGFLAGNKDHSTQAYFDELSAQMQQFENRINVLIDEEPIPKAGRKIAYPLREWSELIIVIFEKASGRIITENPEKGSYENNQRMNDFYDFARALYFARRGSQQEPSFQEYIERYIETGRPEKEEFDIEPYMEGIEKQ